MLAEALHSLADVLNQVLLRVGVLKALKAPTARHPYGHMRDRFVWSLISAVGIFFLGAGASVLHGLHTLFETRVIEGEMWSYVGERTHLDDASRGGGGGGGGVSRPPSSLWTPGSTRRVQGGQALPRSALATMTLLRAWCCRAQCWP